MNLSKDNFGKESFCAAYMPTPISYMNASEV